MTETLPATPSTWRLRLWTAVAWVPQWAVVLLAIILLLAATAWGLLSPIIRERQAILRLRNSLNGSFIKQRYTTCQPFRETTWERVISVLTNGGTWSPVSFEVYLSGQQSSETLHDLRCLRCIEYASLSARAWSLGELGLALRLLRGGERSGPGTDVERDGWNVFRRHPIQGLTIQSRAMDPRSLTDIRSMPELELLSLNVDFITADHVRLLAGHPKLNALLLSGAFLTSDCIDVLTTIPELTHLNLNRSQIEDDFLRQLGRLGKLQDLSIARTKVTDAGLAAIPATVHLDRLVLDDTAITEAGLLSLKGVPKNLSLVGTKVHMTGPLKRWFLSHSFDEVALDDSQLDPTCPTADELSSHIGLLIIFPAGNSSRE